MDFCINIPQFFDQTGMMLLRLREDSTWQLVHNDPKFIEKAQDSRIYWMDGKVVVSFNDDSVEGFPISYRVLTMDNNSSPYSFHLSPAKNMLAHYPTDKIEKNATLIIEDVVQYEFNHGLFTILYKNEKICSPVYHFQHMNERYGSNILFSMSTPAIHYKDDKFLAVGHTKIDYRRSYSEYPEFNAFVKSCPHDHYHDKYIYLMFLYEFNSSLEITRISFNFIPIHHHKSEEKYLVFPSGLFEYNERIYITYGENDIKMKMVDFHREEIEALLDYEQDKKLAPHCAFLERDVVDFTEIIPQSKEPNTFVFNNSMIHWKDDLFLSVYRIVSMQSENKTFWDPMNIWYEVWGWNSESEDIDIKEEDGAGPRLLKTSNRFRKIK